MSEAVEDATAGPTADLGEIEPNGSRQLGRRSAVCWCGDAVVAGLDDGTVVAFEGETLAERWRVAGDGASVVSLSAVDGGVLVGERGPDGTVRLLEAATGECRWRYDTAADVGSPTKETRFFLPFVVDVVGTDDAAFLAARRYERGPDGERTFRSVVYAVEGDGTVRWRHETDASPIALDVRGDRVAVSFNRCPGADRDGVRILDAGDGSLRRHWDPPGEGQRRVGDVSLLSEGFAAASHADYRGYRVDDGGVRWRVDLGQPVDRGNETVYAYPNHVHATASGVVFVTGNTYPEDGRETDARHPGEHAAVGVDPAGEARWMADVGGFAHGIGTDGDRIAVPVAQHFRERDPARHGVVVLDVADGRRWREPTAGVATAAASGAGTAVIEEPVAYHDDDATLGAYRLHRAGRSEDGDTSE